VLLEMLLHDGCSVVCACMDASCVSPLECVAHQCALLLAIAELECGQARIRTAVLLPGRNGLPTTVQTRGSYPSPLCLTSVHGLLASVVRSRPARAHETELAAGSQLGSAFVLESREQHERTREGRDRELMSA
jgi:hypothetical protein